MKNDNSKLLIQRNAKISGFFFLLIILSSLVVLAFLDPKIGTIKDIAENETYFRIDIGYTLFMYICVLILNSYLYRTLKYVDKSLATVAWSLRLAEGILGGVKVLCFLLVLLILNGENHTQLFNNEQLYAWGEVFTNAYWEMTKVIFSFLGLGSVAYFILFLKSKYIPKAISIWGICSYSLVAIGSFISIIGDNNAYMILGSQTILFEIFIGAWLLFKGLNISQVNGNQNVTTKD
jgi:hypothetical protein